MSEELGAVELNQVGIIIRLRKNARHQIRGFKAKTKASKGPFNQSACFAPFAIGKERTNTERVSVVRQWMIFLLGRSLDIMQASEDDLKPSIGAVHQSFDACHTPKFLFTIRYKEAVRFVQQEENAAPFIVYRATPGCVQKADPGQYGLEDWPAVHLAS